MKRKRFSVEQIVAILKQAELGMPVAEFTRQVGISETTFYRWKKAIRWPAVRQGPGAEAIAGRERLAEEAGGRAEPGQGDPARHQCKTMARPALKRQAVDYVVSQYGISRRRACRVIQQHRSVQYYHSQKDLQVALISRMHEPAATRVCYGYRRLHILLRREGWHLGKDKAYRLYSEEHLQLRSKLPRRRKMVVVRRDTYRPKRTHQAWCMDSVEDQLADGTRLRLLTILDVFSRASIAIRVGQRLRAENVVDECNRLVARRGAPILVLMDNGSEFSRRLMDLWAYHHHVRLNFSRPGKPTDNAFIESFNGTLRKECPRKLPALVDR